MSPSRSTDISIADLDKGAVLAALYNNSQVQGMGFLQAESGEMTVEEAGQLLERTTSFDYLKGKVMKINLSGSVLNPWGYDRDNGEGAAARVIDRLREDPDATGKIGAEPHGSVPSDLNTDGGFGQGFRRERHKERIDLTDSLASAVQKLATDDKPTAFEGNLHPGAVICLGEIMATAEAVDPDSVFGALGPLISLDSNGIYGEDIWRLHHEVAERNVVHTHAMLRAVQLGLMPVEELKEAIAGERKIDLEEVVDKVKERLPAFGGGGEDASHDTVA